MESVRCLSLSIVCDFAFVSAAARTSALKHGLLAPAVGFCVCLLVFIYLATKSVGSINHVNNTVNTTRRVGEKAFGSGSETDK